MRRRSLWLDSVIEALIASANTYVNFMLANTAALERRLDYDETFDICLKTRKYKSSLLPGRILEDTYTRSHLLRRSYLIDGAQRRGSASLCFVCVSAIDRPGYLGLLAACTLSLTTLRPKASRYPYRQLIRVAFLSHLRCSRLLAHHDAG